MDNECIINNDNNQGIINVSSHSTKTYASVIISDSEVTFLETANGAPCRSCLHFVLFIDCVA